MREGKEAIFNTEALLEIDGTMIEELKRLARKSPTFRYRLCLHHSVDDPFQEMIIVHCLGNYSRPHYHPDVTVSMLVLEGALTVFMFDSHGNVTGSTKLAPLGKGKPFCLRIDRGISYVPVCRSDIVVFYEALSGPNRDGEANSFPDWSPLESDSAGIAALRERLGIIPTTQPTENGEIPSS
ncbi:MAG: WbuC family cupin fold metalloprotein [Kiritimatiellia bacterium]|jgi:cupin fold WbuC family metalloprotein|nr:WbuC family cupin fold metalloprotein [Kiritimatiellia bacterium]